MLVLRHANTSKKSGPWQDEDYDVFDGDREVGRIFLDANDTWFCSVHFMLTHRKSPGHVASREDAMAAFKVEYERWLQEAAN